MKDITVLCFSVETLDLGKFWFTNYKSKCSIPIGLQDFLIVKYDWINASIYLIFCMERQHVSLLLLVRCFKACPETPKLAQTYQGFFGQSWGYFHLKKTIQNKRLVNFLIVLKYFFINLIPIISSYPFNCQSHKMVKYTQTIHRQIADELFECV